jgi:hypothetical protein
MIEFILHKRYHVSKFYNLIENCKQILGSQLFCQLI